MRAALPDELELEAFVHGAMCVAYSGRCLLSNALVGRSGNRGACAQPCRWQYHLVEEKRPGEYLAPSARTSGEPISTRPMICACCPICRSCGMRASSA